MHSCARYRLDISAGCLEKKNRYAAKEANRQRGKTHPSLVIAATIPAKIFLINKEVRHDTVHSKEFIKYYNKKFPELSATKHNDQAIQGSICS